MLAYLRTTRSFFLRPVTIVRGYRRADLRPDLVAGLTVAIISLPQSIAYALVAGLPPQMGIFTAIVAPIIAALWGSSAFVQSSPTTALSLLVLASLSVVIPPTSPAFIAAAGLLAIIAGLMQVVMGLVGLGALVNFVSDAVLVGFAAGAGIQIAAGELRHLFGVTYTSENLPQNIARLAEHLPQTNIPTLAMGGATIVLMLALRRYRPKWPATLICLVIDALIFYLLSLGAANVRVIGALPRSLPPLAALPLTDLTLINSLAPGALAVAALGLIQALAIARSLAARSNQTLDNNQEFVGQGIGNIFCGLFSGYPAGGSLSCSAINYEAGARTPLASVFSGLFTLVGMLALAPLGIYLPRVALSGVLIVVGLAMIDRRQISRIWRGSRGDAAIMLATLLGTLLVRIDFAVLSGILLSLAYYILTTSTPRVVSVLPDDSFRHFINQPAKPACPQLEIMEIRGDLYFGAVGHIEEHIRRHRAARPGQRFLLLRMQSVNYCDISGIRMLENVARTCRSSGGDLFMVRVSEPVLGLMQTTGFAAYLGMDHFLEEDQAIDYLFHRQIDPAVCIYECEVRAFRECQNLPKRSVALNLPLLPAAHEQGLRVTPEELWQRLHDINPPMVLDVREPREFAQGHVPRARLLPLGELLATPRDLPQGRGLVIVCRSGRRSARAAALLHSRGYTNISILSGGMLAWEAADLLSAVGDQEEARI